MAKTEYEFIFAGIRAYSEGSKPAYWFGAYLDSNGEYVRHWEFTDFFNDLTREIEGKRKVVVFFDLEYDMSIMQYHARKELKYKFNPLKKGQKKSIYVGLHTEVFAENHLVPTIFVDYGKYDMSANIHKMAKFLGREIPERRTVDGFHYLIPEDDEALKAELEVLRDTFYAYKYDDSFKKGHLTVSSIAKGKINKRHADMKGTKYNPSFKLQFTPNNNEKKEKPIPIPLKRRIELDVEAFKERNSLYDERTRTYVYSVNKAVLNEYRLKLISYWCGQYSKKYKHFKNEQNKVAKILEVEGKHTAQTYDFMTLELPEGVSPLYNDLAKKNDYERVVEAMNHYIAPNMSGPLVRLIPYYQSKLLSDKYGGVTLDINSLYNYIILNYELPYKYVGSTGMDKDGFTEVFPDPNRSKYYVAEISVLKATLKEGKTPFLRRGGKYNHTQEFLYSSSIEWEAERKYGVTNSTLNTLEVDWLYECYDVHEIKYERVFYFEADDVWTQSVREELEEWRYLKENAKTDIERQHVKNLSNTTWGSWAMLTKEVQSGAHTIDVGRKTTNLVSAIFVLTMARIILTKMINKLGSRVIYSHTDSVHIKYDEHVNSIEDIQELVGDIIDQKEYGKWKIETEWKRAIYHGNNCYCLEKHDGSLKVTVSGADVRGIEKIEDFYKGRKIPVAQKVKDDEDRIVIKYMDFTLGEMFL